MLFQDLEQTRCKFYIVRILHFLFLQRLILNSVSFSETRHIEYSQAGIGLR